MDTGEQNSGPHDWPAGTLPSHLPSTTLPLLEPRINEFMWCVLWGKMFFTARAFEIHLSCHCSFCWVVFHYLNELLCVYPFSHWHLLCFLCGAVMRKATGNILHKSLEGHMFLFLLGKCPRIVGAVFFFFFLERKKKKLSESERKDSFGEGACHEACRPELHSILWHMWGPSISELKMLERPARLSP